MINAVIFDMDGVLIDSEPLWKMAEKKVFAEVGIIMTTEMCNLTMGYRTNEVVEYWYKLRPWQSKSQEAVTEDLVTTVIESIMAHGKEMKGVRNALERLRTAGYKIALASSSPMRIIDSVLDLLQIRDYFDVVQSAEKEAYGKPHPAVFLTAAARLKVHPLDCLVIEDSVNGVIAGKAARMKVIAIPDPSVANDKRFGIADHLLSDLDQFTGRLLK
jgi:HAD superfamily hydrolase (TIGR01509 family)